MKRRMSKAPFAIASDGEIFVNFAEFDREELPEDLHERGEVFVGIALSSPEVKILLERLDECAAEAAARIVATRHRRRRATARKRRRTAS